MPEATMICCDCSEWMRNGDLVPNRFGSQIDAVGVISNRKTEQNHENTVGLISMGQGGKAEVLVNCTDDVGRVLSSLNKMGMNGKADILVALQTAQLALKHRKNKKQDQRIILFVGSPVVTPEKQLVKAGKRLKKNNVAVDIVSFGETEDNKAILDAFINAVKSNDNSSLVEVDSGMLISDSLEGTTILSMPGGGGGNFGGMGQSEEQQIAAATAASAAMGNANQGGGAAAGGGGGGGGNAFAEYGGIDPNMDPEMAMAIRMSLQEERQRQQTDPNGDDANPAAAAPNANADGSAAAAVAVVPNAAAAGGNDAPAAGGGDDDDIDMDDEDLMMALKMSLMADEDNADANANDNATGNDNTNDDDDDEQAMLDDLLHDLPGLNADDLNDLLDDNDNDKNKEDDKDKK